MTTHQQTVGPSLRSLSAISKYYSSDTSFPYIFNNISGSGAKTARASTPLPDENLLPDALPGSLATLGTKPLFLSPRARAGSPTAPARQARPGRTRSSKYPTHLLLRRAQPLYKQKELITGLNPALLARFRDYSQPLLTLAKLCLGRAFYTF